jgi:hypothetical protein
VCSRVNTTQVLLKKPNTDYDCERVKANWTPVKWALAVMAGICCIASTFVREGDGHEIRLEGDDEAEEEAERANRSLT